MNKKVPVLVLAFNRPDHVFEVMKVVREYQPQELYLACDGPRHLKLGEGYVVEKTRRVMLDAIDWSCNVHRLFHKENKGCANAVYEAVTWFFKHEKYGVIIEDDIVLSQDFFLFCEDMLPRYIGDERIMHINSQNYSFGPIKSNEYVFGKMSYCWGWATWARAWNKMDMQMKKWDSFDKTSLFKYFGFFNGAILWKYYWSTHKFLEKSTSWAVRWDFSILVEDGICISPKVNLSKNIGIGEFDGTHYSSNDKNPYVKLNVGELSWPLKIRNEVLLDQEQLDIDNKDFTRLRLLGLKKKIYKIFS